MCPQLEKSAVIVRSSLNRCASPTGCMRQRQCGLPREELTGVKRDNVLFPGTARGYRGATDEKYLTQREKKRKGVPSHGIWNVGHSVFPARNIHAPIQKNNMCQRSFSLSAVFFAVPPRRLGGRLSRTRRLVPLSA